MRVGHGFDIRAFGGEDPIIIDGIRTPHEEELLVHSDGDVTLCMLADALLGTTTLGDIGKLLPDTDPALKGVGSHELLHKAWRHIQAKDYALGDADVVIIARVPKTPPHIPQIHVLIAEDLGCRMGDVSVKAITIEKLSFTGRGEGITYEVIVLLHEAER